MKNRTERPDYASIQVLDRVVLLLNAVAKAREATLKVLALETGLHTSTAFRILAALDSHGLVARDDAGRYRLGPHLVRLGSAAQERLDIAREARPILQSLRAELQETVNLTVREGDEVVYIERAVADRAMRVEHVIGSRAPLHVTAVGKLFLGEAGGGECSRYARRSKLKAYTAKTLRKTEELVQAAQAAARDGYALDDEEAEEGVGCIGVPVRDSSGHMVAALSVSAPIERRRLDWVAVLKRAAAELSQRLGYTPAASG
jgi:DNA-binding IclR family transcriptional regulator